MRDVSKVLRNREYSDRCSVSYNIVHGTANSSGFHNAQLQVVCLFVLLFVPAL